jgi:hypothetical protein
MLKNWFGESIWRLLDHWKSACIRRDGPKAAKPPYTVLVDDNYHYMDESERYTLGAFRSAEVAIEACKRLVDDFLEASCKGLDPSSEKLYEHYVAFGPDPFIVTNDPGIPEPPFSAWEYAREQCFGHLAKPEKPESK